MKIIAEKKHLEKILLALNTENSEGCYGLLHHFVSFSSENQNKILFEISLKNDRVSFELLTILAGQVLSDTIISNRIFDLVIEKAQSNPSFIKILIEKGNTEKIKEAVPIFANILITETDEEILRETILTIGNIREASCINVVADFIFYGHDELKMSAVKTLYKIGTKDAFEKLSIACSTSKTEPYMEDILKEFSLRLEKNEEKEHLKKEQFASRRDTICSLDDGTDLSGILSMFNSSLVLDRHMALELLIEMGAKVVPVLSYNMDIRNADSVILTLDILGYIGSGTSIKTIMKVINSCHEEPEVRIAVFQAMHRLPANFPMVRVLEGLSDPSEQVRIAAACAIDHNLSDILLEGLKGKLEGETCDSEKENIVTAIIDSHADNIFKKLWESAVFYKLASEYLKSASPSTRTHFTKIIDKMGYEIQAAMIDYFSLHVLSGDSATVYVVDSSAVMLWIYRKYLLELGYTPVIFEDPVLALSEMKKKKPDVVIADLFIFKMNGMQLLEEIRSVYDLEELPVAITVSTSFLNNADREKQGRSLVMDQIADSGANYILNKPISKSEIDNFITRKLKHPVLNISRTKS